MSRIEDTVAEIIKSEDFLTKLCAEGFKLPTFGGGMDCIIFLSGMLDRIATDLKSPDLPHYPTMAANLLAMKQAYEALTGEFKDEVHMDTVDAVHDMWPEGLTEEYVATIVVVNSIQR